MTATAIGFELTTCRNPKCGVHLALLDKDNRAICETVIPREYIPNVVRVLQSIAYEKAALDDY